MNSMKGISMDAMFATVSPLAAAGYSLVYLLAGGGIGGAILIFVGAKMLGK
jgi:hypothetical protein